MKTISAWGKKSRFEVHHAIVSRALMRTILATCFALALTTACTSPPKPQAEPCQSEMDRIKSPASPGERGQLVTADPPAAATQTELDTANKHLPLLRFSMQEREILELLGLSRFYGPTGRTSWSGYM